MASPSEGDVETAAAALIQAGEEICDQEEEEEVADIDHIPFGTQEEVEEAMTHARTAKPSVAIRSLLTQSITAGRSRRSASSAGQPKPG